MLNEKTNEKVKMICSDCNVEKDERKSWYDVFDESPVERVDDVELFLRE